jgi:dTDP-4-amino-4,6-dideoxygalactose transaminase
MIANHGRLDSKYNHYIEGRNSRLDAIQSAVLGVKLKYLDSWIEKKNQLTQVYFNSLQDLSSVTLPILYSDRFHGYHLFVVRAHRRDELKQHLYGRGIESGIHYPMALPTLAAYDHQHFNQSDFVNAITYSKEIISLPLYPEISEEEVLCITQEIKNFYEQD